MSKYGAKKSQCLHGHTHDSIKEAKRCNELHLLERSRLITDLEVQPQFWFVIDGKQVKNYERVVVGKTVDLEFP